MTRANADLDHLDKNGRTIHRGNAIRWTIKPDMGGNTTGEPIPAEGNVVKFVHRKDDRGREYDMLYTDNNWLLFPWAVELAEPWLPEA